jgi:hypothetical protein
MKGKEKSINTPMKGSTIDTQHPGGEFGTGIDFAKEPTEGISGHNIYQNPEGASYGGVTPRSKITSPAKVVKRVDTKE